jgi:carotenoid 1,2-hydratase
VGSVFSPYYRLAQRRGRASAEDHCALNVALYSPGAERWTMTERGARHVQRTRSSLRIGPSAVSWDGHSLSIRVDERACPVPRRVRGRVTVHADGVCDFVTALDTPGRHRWGPIAPRARVEVAFDEPALSWRGHAYIDSNEGDEPVTEAFAGWDWLRAPLADGSTAVVYDVRQRQGLGERLIALRFAPSGTVCPFEPAAARALPLTRWRVLRRLRADAGGVVRRTLEDTPFYARSLLECRLEGQPVQAMHETLDVRRLARPLVQAMLPVRMPRRA